MKIISLLLVLLFSASVIPASAQIGPSGVGFVNGYFIGPDTILVEADLTGADLINANLYGATSDDITPMMTAIQTLQTTDTTNTAAIATNTSEIEAIKAQLATLVDALAAKDAEIEQQALRIAEVEAQRDARPTQEQLAAVEAERDAKFTEAQIRAMSADPTAGLNDEGNVQVDISFIHSSDLVNFQPFTLTPEMMSVADGKLRMQFPPMDQEAFFYRLGIE